MNGFWQVSGAFLKLETRSAEKWAFLERFIGWEIIKKT